jgi:hypothetical protein
MSLPQIADRILVLNGAHVSEGTMKDPHSVLREKEQDLARVRREIQAVLTAIPLLADDPPTSDVVHEVPLASSQTPVSLPDNDMAQLEIYFPFVRHLLTSNRRSGGRPLGPLASETPQSQTAKGITPPRFLSQLAS